MDMDIDMGTSVITKLKNKSKETGKPLQLYLQLFCQEEFLRKVALSKYVDNLVLKGGLFIYALTNFESRSTIDVDFLLQQFPNSVKSVRGIVEEILSINTGNDFIIFESKEFVTISPQRKYTGVGVQIVGRIKNTKTPFNVDFGVDDIIVPKAKKRTIPTQLDKFDAPEISTYSLESTVSEKFDAILQRLELTSRMKDYYDIFYIAHTFEFDGRILQEAILETLKKRGTDYSRESFNNIMAFSNDEAMQTKWRQFLKKLKVNEPEFKEALQTMNYFLGEIWLAIINETEFFGQWHPQLQVYSK